MKALPYALGVALGVLPVVAAAQNSLSDAFRASEQRYARILTAALDSIPADKFAYKPTPAQMSVADIAVHLAEGNDMLCSSVGGTTAPQRTPITATSPRDTLLARLRATFAYCQTALAGLSDAQLGDSVPSFGGRKTSRGNMILITQGDWADHYSQLAIYMRLNGLMPPTARRGN
jgi:hypothetical protein